jgi:HK97 family phage portal protein
MAKTDENTGLIRRIVNQLVGTRTTTSEPANRRAVGEAIFGEAWGTGSVQSRATDGAESNIIIARAVNIISTTLASVPIKLYRGEEEINSGPLYELLKNPNNLEAWPRFCSAFTSMALVDGQSFAILGERRPSTTIPVDMIPASSSEVKPVRDEGSQYGLDGWEIAGIGIIDSDRVIRFEYSGSPNDPLGAVSPLAAAASDIEADDLAASFNRYALESGGAVAGVLSWTNPDVRLSEQDLDRASRSFEEKYSGSQNANSTAVLSGDWNYQSLGQNSKDLEYIEGRRFIQQRLALIYGIPPVLLGDYSDAGLGAAGLDTARRILYENAIIPFARSVQASLTRSLCRQNEQIRFDFSQVEALREDFTQKLDQATKLAAIGYPVNALNETLGLGLPEVPWGDDALVNSGLTTAESLTAIGDLNEQEADTESESGSLQLDSSQMATAIGLVEKVQSGALPRDSAKAMLVQLIGLTDEQAEQFLGSAGQEQQVETSTPEAPVDGGERGASGDGGSEAVVNFTPETFTEQEELAAMARIKAWEEAGN